MADASQAPSGKLMTHRVVHKSCTDLSTVDSRSNHLLGMGLEQTVKVSHTSTDRPME